MKTRKQPAKPVKKKRLTPRSVDSEIGSSIRAIHLRIATIESNCATLVRRWDLSAEWMRERGQKILEMEKHAADVTTWMRERDTRFNAVSAKVDDIVRGREPRKTPIADQRVDSLEKSMALMIERLNAMDIANQKKYEHVLAAMKNSEPMHNAVGRTNERIVALEAKIKAVDGLDKRVSAVRTEAQRDRNETAQALSDRIDDIYRKLEGGEDGVMSLEVVALRAKMGLPTFEAELRTSVVKMQEKLDAHMIACKAETEAGEPPEIVMHRCGLRPNPEGEVFAGSNTMSSAPNKSPMFEIHGEILDGRDIMNLMADFVPIPVQLHPGDISVVKTSYLLKLQKDHDADARDLAKLRRRQARLDKYHERLRHDFGAGQLKLQDLRAERDGLEKMLEYWQKRGEDLERQINNPGFISQSAANRIYELGYRLTQSIDAEKDLQARIVDVEAERARLREETARMERLLAEKPKRNLASLPATMLDALKRIGAGA